MRRRHFLAVILPLDLICGANFKPGLAPPLAGHFFTRPDGMPPPRHGNYEVAACCHPRITTVDIECYEIGRQAALSLIRTIQEPANPARRQQVLTKIRVIEREST